MCNYLPYIFPRKNIPDIENFVTSARSESSIVPKTIQKILDVNKKIHGKVKDFTVVERFIAFDKSALIRVPKLDCAICMT